MDTFSIDHIQPQSKGGSNELSNLAFACQGCNACKNDRTEILDRQINQPIPLYNPRKMQWNEHFTWSQDYTQIVSKTPIGEITIQALQLNRIGNQNLRRVLYQSGDHPP